MAVLTSVIERCAEPAQRAWFAAALVAARSRSATDVAAAYAGASRRLGTTVATISAGDAAALEECGLRRVDVWPADRMARAALICEMARWPDATEAVDQAFRGGDNDERIALLGVLAALPDAARFVSTAVSACRTNVISVFEAVACENPYPAAHFSDAELNQMVLKALFNGISVSRIEGLRARANGELARMVEAYASERRAAGRSVPGDVDLILAMETPAS